MDCNERHFRVEFTVWTDQLSPTFTVQCQQERRDIVRAMIDRAGWKVIREDVVIVATCVR